MPVLYSFCLLIRLHLPLASWRLESSNSPVENYNMGQTAAEQDVESIARRPHHIGCTPQGRLLADMDVRSRFADAVDYLSVNQCDMFCIIFVLDLYETMYMQKPQSIDSDVTHPSPSGYHYSRLPH